MIKSVISDLGKVIVFFDDHIFFNKMACFCPFTEEQIAEKMTGQPDLIRSFDTGKITPEVFYERSLRILEAKLDYETFYSIYNDIFLLDPPILEVFKKLKPRYRLVLLSNTDVMRFGFIQRKFPEILIFDDYVLSYEVGTMKPDPLIYRTAVKKAKARIEECLFIDDRAENIQAAEALGMEGIHFLPETDLEAELRRKNLSF